MNSQCPRVEGVRKELRLTGLRWDAISGDAALRSRMEAALRSDVALSLGVDEETITNGTLVRDTTQQLTSSSSSRRQSSGTTNGAKYEFQIAGASQEEAAANAAAFDTAVQQNA